MMSDTIQLVSLLGASCNGDGESGCQLINKIGNARIYVSSIADFMLSLINPRNYITPFHDILL